MFVCNSHDYVLFFTNLGRVYRLKAYEIPEGSRTSKGMNIANLLPLAQEERITSVIRVPEFEEDRFLVMVTRCGIIKRTDLSAYDTARKGGLIALDLNEGDELAWVRMTKGESELLVATRKGMAIRFAETDVRSMGRTARGVKAITLGEGDEVVGMAILHAGQKVLTVSETGYGRLSPIENYRMQSRGGLKNYHTEKYGEVATVLVVDPENDDVIIISSDGVIIRVCAGEIRECARPSKGVKVMRLAEDSRVVTLARVPHAEGEATETIEDDGSDADEGAETEAEMEAEAAEETGAVPEEEQ